MTSATVGKKKSAAVQLVEEIDAVVRAKVMARDRAEFGDKCCLCGGQGNLQWCHLISASKYSVRWHPLNSYTQCRGCNIRHEYHPQYYTAWWIARHGEEKYQELATVSSVPADFNVAQLRTILEGVKELPL
jgi:hypothetical protein